MRNTLKIFLRTLYRKKFYSVLTIGGYAISMSVILVIASFIIQETNTDKSFKNIEQIYRIKRSNNNAQIPETLLDDVKETIPEVNKMCLYNVAEKAYFTDGKMNAMSVISTNDDFIEMFSFQFIFKSDDPTLLVKDNIILTKSFSEKLFGAKNPVGKLIDVGDSNSLKIVGVVSDLPSNSSFNFEAIVSSKMPIGRHYVGYNDEQHVMFKSLIMLHPYSNKTKVSDLIKDKINHWQAFKDQQLSIQPFKKVYFDSHTFNDGLNHANKNMIYLLSVIALLILFMTIFNYVNLTISGGFERMKEIGIRRTTGASPKIIFRQIIFESILTTFLAMLGAVILAILIAPIFSAVINISFDLKALLTKPSVTITGLILFIITGAVAGIYPAFILSKATPLKNLAQKKPSIIGSKGILITSQFVITITLMLSLIVINKQLKFIKHKDLGFDQDSIVKLKISGMPPNDREVFRNKLSNYQGIGAISSSTGTPMELIGNTSSSFEINGIHKTLFSKSFSIDQDFIPMFKIKMIHGRNFNDSDRDHKTCLINEHLFKELEWNNLADKQFNGRTVVGVVNNFNYENLYTDVGNLIMTKEPSRYANHLNIKITGEIGSAMKIINDTYKQFSPKIPISYRFYDDWLQSMYQKEEKQASAISFFTIIAIIISCLGLIGFIKSLSIKKTKEIGIRKVNGAKISEVLILLNKDFVKWVTIAFVIATPIAYYAMSKWLENFAYKTTLSWWIFALAGVLALGIALLTVSWQSWRAATRNPVEALRYE